MVNVLFFAHLQEEVGESQVELEVDSMTVNQLKQEIQQKYNLRELNNIMVSVNEEFVQDDDLIHRGDDVAFIPPISGG